MTTIDTIDRLSEKPVSGVIGRLKFVGWAMGADGRFQKVATGPSHANMITVMQERAKTNSGEWRIYVEGIDPNARPAVAGHPRDPS